LPAQIIFRQQDFRHAGKHSGSWRFTHSNFGAVNPGIIRLPVIARAFYLRFQQRALFGAAAVIPQNSRTQY
jgi:hypothetical protein